MGWFNRHTPTPVEVPSGETQTLSGLKTYIVTWLSRTGSYHSDRTLTAQAFTNEEDAHKFVKALHSAAQLIKCGESLDIKIKEV